MSEGESGWHKVTCQPASWDVGGCMADWVSAKTPYYNPLENPSGELHGFFI